MPSAWRIVRTKYAESAFTGEGAAKFGGRWNSRGTWVVYTSSTMSLAALEILVHLNPMPELTFMAFQIDFGDLPIEHLNPKHLPKDWKAEPPGQSTQVIGSDWARFNRTAVLQVPSVLVPSESTYLLNPAHSDFKKIRIEKPEPFVFDPRLLK